MMFPKQKRLRALCKADLINTNHFQWQIKHSNSGTGTQRYQSSLRSIKGFVIITFSTHAQLLGRSYKITLHTKANYDSLRISLQSLLPVPTTWERQGYSRSGTYLGMVSRACSPSTWETKAENCHEFQARLGYTGDFYLKQTNKEITQRTKTRHMKQCLTLFLAGLCQCVITTGLWAAWHV